MKLERRLFTTEFKSMKVADKPTQLVGYASVFNQPSCDLGGFTEIIKPGAFTRTLESGADVRALFNHDINFILGRTIDGGKTGTLSLSQDDIGLRFVVDMPDTQVGRDLLTLVDRGDISQNSFGFMVRQQNWRSVKGADGTMQRIREIIECDLNGGDVSPVTYPAYPQTTLEARSAFMYPDGVPEEISTMLKRMVDCSCDCPECQDGDCQDCSADPMCGNQSNEQVSLENARLVTAQIRTKLIKL